MIQLVSDSKKVAFSFDITKLRRLKRAFFLSELSNNTILDISTKQTITKIDLINLPIKLYQTQA